MSEITLRPYIEEPESPTRRRRLVAVVLCLLVAAGGTLVTLARGDGTTTAAAQPPASRPGATSAVASTTIATVPAAAEQLVPQQKPAEPGGRDPETDPGASDEGPYIMLGGCQDGLCGDKVVRPGDGAAVPLEIPFDRGPAGFSTIVRIPGCDGTAELYRPSTSEVKYAPAGVGGARVGFDESVAPGSYDITLRCDADGRLATGTFHVTGPLPTAHAITTRAVPGEPVTVGGDACDLPGGDIQIELWWVGEITDPDRPTFNEVGPGLFEIVHAKAGSGGAWGPLSSAALSEVPDGAKFVVAQVHCAVGEPSIQSPWHAYYQHLLIPVGPS